MSLHNSCTGNKPVIMGQSQTGYRGRVLPNLLGAPSPAKVGKMVPKGACLLGATCGECSQLGGMAKEDSSLEFQLA